MLRRDALCKGLRACHDITVTCIACGVERIPDDPNFPAPCECGSTGTTKNRCESCPLTKLDAAQNSAAGALAQRVMDIHFALGKHFNMRLDEITCEEFQVLKIIEMESAEYQKEQEPPSK